MVYKLYQFLVQIWFIKIFCKNLYEHYIYIFSVIYKFVIIKSNYWREDRMAMYRPILVSSNGCESALFQIWNHCIAIIKCSLCFKWILCILSKRKYSLQTNTINLADSLFLREVSFHLAHPPMSFTHSNN